MHGMYKHCPGFFYFCVQNVLSLIYIGDESGRNDLKATGGVETFAC